MWIAVCFFHLQMRLQQTSFENIMAKGNIATVTEQYLLFPQGFLCYSENIRKINLIYQPLPTYRSFKTPLQQNTFGNIVANAEIARYIYFLQRTNYGIRKGEMCLIFF